MRRKPRWPGLGVQKTIHEGLDRTLDFQRVRDPAERLFHLAFIPVGEHRGDADQDERQHETERDQEFIRSGKWL